MLDRLIHISLLATVMTLALPAIAQDDVDSPPTSPDTEATENSSDIEVPQSFQPLMTEFLEIEKKIKAAGNNVMTDRDAILALREKVIAFNEQRTPTEKSLAAELQLLQWATSSPEERAAFFERFDSLDIEHPGLRIYWTMDLLQRQNRPTRALRVLEEKPVDLADYPVAGVLRAQALIAQNEFDEAIAALDAIPSDADNRADFLDRMYQLRKQVEELQDDWKRESELRTKEATADDLPRVELSTNKGSVVLELYENEAPNTVANFITLVESGYYNNMKFSRILPGTQVNAGDPTQRTDLVTSPEISTVDYKIKNETEPGVYRSHFAGTVAMANLLPNTAAAEFMINLRARPERDGRATVFGRIIEGREVVEQIEEDDLIESATVIRKRDHDYTVEKVGDEKPDDETTEEDATEADEGSADPETTPDNDSSDDAPVDDAYNQ